MENEQKNVPTAPKIYSNLKKLSEKDGEIELRAEISVEAMEEFINHALAHVGREMEIPGFRKGKVPQNIVRERVDEMWVLETAADEALRDAVRDIIDDQELSIVGTPRLTLTKLAPKNPVEFKVLLAIYPDVKLPDYKKIGATIAERKDEAAEVTEADMKEAITRLMAMVALQRPELDADKEKMPELTDEIVKSFGAFENVDDFKMKLKENLAKDKVLQVKEARREEIMHMIVEQSKVKIPDMLIDEEWYAFEERRNAQLAEAKISLEDYLKQTNKTEKDLEKEERKLIEERIKTSIVFREIQKVENIEPTEKEIQTNIAYLKLRYPDRAENWLRQTAEAVLVQEKIFKALGLPLADDAEGGPAVI